MLKKEGLRFWASHSEPSTIGDRYFRRTKSKGEEDEERFAFGCAPEGAERQFLGLPPGRASGRCGLSPPEAWTVERVLARARCAFGGSKPVRPSVSYSAVGP